MVHFYETFLAAYDPKMRKSRGVYYTPEPVVQFIVNSVDWLLKNRFEQSWGLADPSVKILDPATGTGTFLYYVIQSIHEEITRRGQEGSWAEKSKELLKRVFGFELLMAPYVISHLKLGLLMQELGAPITQNERLQVYLTNTLEEGVTRSETFESLGFYIAEEASQAAQVKKQEDIMVVLGNPPYSGNSANTGEWITNLVRDSYYPHDEIKEHNPKMLLDDYVKFIRFGEWRIQQTGHGVLAFISNNGYIDNPTFREMRLNLLINFSDIYIFDLHGNTRKKESAPDGSKDENVFDIQQGVAILLAIKKINTSNSHAKVHHAQVWGLRENKYSLLLESGMENIEWSQVLPVPPFYIFAPQKDDASGEFEKGFRVPEIFLNTSTGVKTHRDHFAIDFDKSKLLIKISSLGDKTRSISDIKEEFKLEDTRDWKLSEARKKFSELTNWQSDFSDYAHRPFDNRVIYLNQVAVELPRFEIMKHLKYKNNIALGVGRQGLAVSQEEWNLIICADKPIDTNVFRRGGIQIFPLYLYTEPEETVGTLFAQSETTRIPNLAPRFIEDFSAKLGLQFIQDGKGDLKNTFGPEDVFYYAYAVFHSPTYRERYAAFLKIDFPRLPLTSDKKLFRKLASKGEELVGLHLLKSSKVDDFITSFPITSSNSVEKVGYASNKVWINSSQYFGGVPEKVWNFKIGGYQVCDKWLKDRKGRSLSGKISAIITRGGGAARNNKDHGFNR